MLQSFAITAGTGKSHALIALVHAAIETGLKVRYFSAAELVENLYRGLADNSVGKLIETVLRNDIIICDEVGFAPLDPTGSQLLFRFVAAAYERRSLAIASHRPSRNGAGSCPSTPPQSASWTGSCTTTASSPPTARAPPGFAVPRKRQPDLCQTGHVLGMTLGILLTGVTVLGSVWDWYRHPFT